MPSLESARPRPVSSIPSFEATVDVIVIGFGCAGACAAIEARAAGAEVLVLERSGGGGGTSANSGGLIYLGGGTALQRACGFDDTPDAMYRFLTAASGPGYHEAKLRALCDGAAAHYDWLVDHGVPFEESFHPEPGMEPPGVEGLVYSGGEDRNPFDRIAPPAPRAHIPKAPGAAGGFLMQCLIEATVACAAAVEVNTRVQALVEDLEGRCVGVVARSAGRERAFRARRGIVLAGGGFVANPELVALHAPQIARCQAKNGIESDDGFVMRMGQAAGGNLIRMETGEVALPVTIPHRLGRGLFLNALAQRYINEDTYFGHIGQASLMHWNGDVWFLADEAIWEPNILKMQPTFVAETLGELETEAGFPAGALEESVERYNRFARKGEDPFFRKRSDMLQPLETPPYALVDCRPEHCLYAGFTTGGLHTAVGGEILDVDGAPLPGIFAAGRSAALCSGRYYPASGISLADGTYFGRLAGISAANERG